MTSFIRFSLACALLVAACGDDGNTTDDPTAGTTTGNNNNTTGSGTTDDSPTSTTDDSPTSTTSDDATSTTDDGTSTTSDDTTSTTDDTTGQVGSTTDDSTTGEPAGLSWEKDVYPIVVEGKCGCHGGGVGGLTITDAASAYNNIVNIDATQVDFKRVAPGDSANSYFLAKVAGTAGQAPFNSATPAQMPKNQAPLSQVAIDTLTQWIDEGANP